MRRRPCALGGWRCSGRWGAARAACWGAALPGERVPHCARRPLVRRGSAAGGARCRARAQAAARRAASGVWPRRSSRTCAACAAVRWVACAAGCGAAGPPGRRIRAAGPAGRGGLPMADLLHGNGAAGHVGGARGAGCARMARRRRRVLRARDGPGVLRGRIEARVGHQALARRACSPAQGPLLSPDYAPWSSESCWSSQVPRGLGLAQNLRGQGRLYELPLRSESLLQQVLGQAAARKRACCNRNADRGQAQGALGLQCERLPSARPHDPQSERTAALALGDVLLALGQGVAPRALGRRRDDGVLRLHRAPRPR